MAIDNIFKAIQSLLETDVDVNASVSGQITAGVAPTNWKLPYITFDRFASNGVNHMLGASGFSRDSFQVSIFNEKRGQGFEIFDLVRLAIDGLPHTTVGTVIISTLKIVNSSDDILPPDDGSEIPTFRTRLDFEVWYRRSIPDHS